MNDLPASNPTKEKIDALMQAVQIVGDTKVTEQLGDDLSATIDGRHKLQDLTIAPKFFLDLLLDFLKSYGIDEINDENLEKLEVVGKTFSQMIIMLINKTIDKSNHASAQKMAKLTADFQSSNPSDQGNIG